MPVSSTVSATESPFSSAFLTLAKVSVSSSFGRSMCLPSQRPKVLPEQGPVHLGKLDRCGARARALPARSMSSKANKVGSGVFLP